MGRKTYAIGNEIKVSGFRKKDVSMDDFNKGIITSKKMKTIKSSKDIKEVGGFVEETRDLNVQLENNREIEGIYREEKLFKDKDIIDISFFQEKLVKIAEN